MVPKFYAIHRAEAVARRVARPLRGFSVLFAPLIGATTAMATGVLRLLGVEMTLERRGGSPDELKLLIAESYEGGHIDPGEAGMLTGVFHLHEQEARQVMTPAPAVVTADVSENVQTALRLCISSGHTRLVVTEDHNPDRVRGLVHASSLADLLMREGADAPIESIVHDAPIVPETKPLDDLLAELQRSHTSLAVVVDEYGRVVGVVTVEDIVEEVVGEISDETDAASGEIRKLAGGDWFVRGHVAVTDLIDYGLELPVDTDAYNSVGGFVFAELGRLPRRGDTVTADGFSIRVESVRDNRVEAVRIRERAPRPRPQGETEGARE
jgi:CBS domain containing-hemolysin-like protein